MAELINEKDSLNTGRKKLNNAIVNADEAKQKSNQAVNVSEQAKQIAQTAENKADNVQEQFNQVVIEGDSSVEAAQARVTADGRVFDTLRDRLNYTDTQLAQNTIKAIDNYIDVARTNAGNAPMVTFVDDDYHYEAVMGRLKPIFVEKGVPLVIAMYYTNTTPKTRADLREMKDEHGWEVAWHGYDNGYFERDYTDEQLHQDFQFCRTLSNAENLDIENVVYPHGNTSPRVQRIASQYFKCGVWTYGGLNGQDNLHGSDLKMYRLHRTPFGSYTENWTGVDTLEGYKQQVDEAIATNGWLIYMTHVSHPDHTQEKDQWLAELIDYIKSKGVDIVTLKEGLKRRGQLQKGDAIERQRDHFILNSDGTIVSNSAITYRDYRNLKATTGLNHYKVGKLTVREYINESAEGFPTHYGLLSTYRSRTLANEMGYQIWQPLRSYDIYIRFWNPETREWEPFGRIAQLADLQNLEINEYSFSSKPSDFPFRRTITVPIAEPDSPNKPDGSTGEGVLTNCRVTNSAGYDYQIFKERNSKNMWTRYRNPGDTWSAWEQL